MFLEVLYSEEVLELFRISERFGRRSTLVVYLKVTNFFFKEETDGQESESSAAPLVLDSPISRFSTGLSDRALNLIHWIGNPGATCAFSTAMLVLDFCKFRESIISNFKSV